MMTTKPFCRGRTSVLLITSLALMLSGCATATKGSSQQVALKVKTEQGTPVEGLNCDLSNKLGQWTVAAPGSVEVKRSAGPLMVKCENPEWVMAEQPKVDSNSSLGRSIGKGAAVGAGIGILVALVSPIVILGSSAYALTAVLTGTAGSVYGGATGAVVDASSGAAFEYAPEITVVVKARVVEPAATVAAAH